MPCLPSRFAAVILCFAPLFLQRSWRHAEVLLVGAILAPGQRTVGSLLRITGRGRERRFVNHRRVLNRAAWSRVGARIDCGWRLPSGFAYQTTRTETGTPSRVIRLSTLHPIFASVR
jgi:hypothetical protein